MWIFEKTHFSITSRVVSSPQTSRHMAKMKCLPICTENTIVQKMVEILETVYFNTKIMAFYRDFKHVQMTCPSRSHSLVLIPIFFVNFLKWRLLRASKKEFVQINYIFSSEFSISISVFESRIKIRLGFNWNRTIFIIVLGNLR